MSATGDELRALVRAGWRVVALETFEEDRALAMLERAAATAKGRCVRWTLASGLGETGRGAGSLEAGLGAIAEHRDPALFAILDAHRVLDDPRGVRRLRDLLPELGARRQAVVLVGPVLDLPIELVRDTARLELPLPGAPELRSLFAKLCEKSGAPPPELLDAAVSGALGLSSAEAVRVFRRACGGALLDDAAVAEIVRDKRRALRRTPALGFQDPEAGLGDVGGLGELKVWLAERRRSFGEEARRFGLPTPRGLLLLGVQGCGKSLCAKAVAREWSFPLLRLDLASAFAGGSESPEAAMREAAQVAESIAPAVLWIDEIEKGFAASESDARSSRVFGSFLTWLAEKRAAVFVVATANDVSRLPPELLRRGRFDELFFVDLPSQAERAEILAIHLRKHHRDPKQFRLDELAAAAERLTGAELEQAVIAALHTAFAASRDLTGDDLSNALVQTVPLYETYEERIKELRDWARTRARPASHDARMLDYFA
ncbi:MAG TPA: AAA family ATPase [Myxococcota bacterium]|nr:AAA family ATPase [Myxococcota bacterium]